MPDRNSSSLAIQIKIDGNVLQFGADTGPYARSVRQQIKWFKALPAKVRRRTYDLISHTKNEKHIVKDGIRLKKLKDVTGFDIFLYKLEEADIFLFNSAIKNFLFIDILTLPWDTDPDGKIVRPGIHISIESCEITGRITKKHRPRDNFGYDRGYSQLYLNPGHRDATYTGPYKDVHDYNHRQYCEYQGFANSGMKDTRRRKNQGTGVLGGVECAIFLQAAQLSFMTTRGGTLPPHV